MSYLAGLLTCVLLVIALLLVLLVLVQLPKKDAGAGLAFGGGTADALFGAGSGNALTKITQWVGVIFIVLTLCLGYFQNYVHPSDRSTDFMKSIDQKRTQAPAMTAPPQAPAQTQSVPSTPNALSSINVMGTNSSTVPVTTTNKSK